MNKVIAFMLGAAAGSLLTWKLVENKYKQLADEEIQSVIDHFKNKDKKEENELEQFAEEPKKVDEYTEDKKVYNNIIKDMNYSQDKDYTVYIEPGQEVIPPYVIAPEDFGEAYDYRTKTLTYYADGVLTDEDGEIIVDPESIIGDGLEHFGDFEDDSVHVRNDENECDYQILKHELTFTEINEDDD